MLTFGPLGGQPLIPDFRDIALSATPEFKRLENTALPKKVLHHSANQPWLNQGSEGACVGFGITNVLNANPQPGVLGNLFARDFYRRITQTDSFTGDWRSGQSGTSIRDGAKQAIREGLFSSYAFTASVDVLLRWLAEKGPFYVGIPWYRSMDTIVSGYARINKDSGIRGWHCVAVDGYDLSLNDPYMDHVIFPNSWGHTREFKISIMGLRYLFSVPGVGAITPIERIVK